MIAAFFGTAGRTHAAYAALLLADAYGILGQPVTLLRVRLPEEAPLPRRAITEEGLTVSEREAGDAREAGLIAAEAMAGEGDLILDLPAVCMADLGLRARVEASVLPVGPTPLDEHAAAAALAGMEPSVEFGLDLVPPPWLLGCGRSGGAAAAAAFGHRMRAHDALPPGRGRVRALPMVVPAFGRAEAERIAEGDRTSRSLVASVALLAALRAAASDRHADAVDPVAYAAALGVDAEQARAPDEREAGDRLRELADELQGIRDQVKPAPADLRDAPRLERWRFTSRSVRVLTGEVFGHPNFPDGRRITTSDLYASDGRRWARTLSRYFILGQPDVGAERLDRH
ncbi:MULTISPECIES: hypothetical protein [Methylobacterium]|uniref:Uncharacterized protein n=1 Tax=Methylobacterium mesophilicum SR1.6/6 TaxID=908290 RepID=A0A6B9FKT2_9HYPH|nr:hypothetical protein [Methylobacterium mesophilicum]QGY02987.1 hypothetical protein MMSR116_14685 [Methylobacterium mesophilicum SR1.6/6]